MVAEMALALAAIATRTLVAELVRGAPMNRDSWASVAADVVDVLVTAPLRPTVRPGGGAAQSDGAAERLGRQIAHVAGKIDELPIREFELHMAAGRRFLRDLPREWRTDQQRTELIRDARSEFVRAAAGAELMSDPRRRALAEVAIAGCWLWVPSLPDVKTTVAEARQILEREILFGATLPTGDYADVLKLCRSYGERSERNAAPIIPRAALSAPTPGARLAVAAVPEAWVECAGIEVRIGKDVTGEGPPVAVDPRAAGDFRGLTGPRWAIPPAGSRGSDDPFVFPPAGSRGSDDRWTIPPAPGPMRRSSRLRWDLPQGPADTSASDPPPAAPNPDPGRRISVEVRNTRAEWISLRLTRYAVIAQVAAGRGATGLSNGHRVRPGATAVVELERPPSYPELPGGSALVREPELPAAPTVGFVLPPPPDSGATAPRTRRRPVYRPPGEEPPRRAYRPPGR